MAIESLTDRMFSIQSDVWGITVLKDLIQFLCDGNRMEMPTLGPDLICDIMARCWEKEPGDRPTFNELKIELKNMLKENMIFQQHHLINGS